MDNHLYNLLKAITKKASSVWRYDQYLQDAGNCDQCQAIWNSFKQEDKAHLDRLVAALKDHLGNLSSYNP